ncbi:hypothetical protein DDN77_16630 [Vibrio cholerae]|nr:hypothetical protein [Vibrio cholerae]EGR4155204.1 hypothetical protein [Vibrio cholerae]EGR4261538.1 hypothetical protein [Vibrio cholerae]EGR4417956.1 hypothetical protein [Vibrio cholerae]
MARVRPSSRLRCVFFSIMTLSASNQIGGKDTVTRSKLQAIYFNALLFEGFFVKKEKERKVHQPKYKYKKRSEIG